MKKRFGFKRGFCLVVLGAILMAVLPGVPGVGSGAVVLAQKGKGNKGKPSPEPVTRFEVRYETADDPRDPDDPLFPFNFIPDGEGLFGGKDGVLYTDDGGCLQPDCPYVAYSGETGHPIRGKWPPGRSEATLGIS